MTLGFTFSDGTQHEHHKGRGKQRTDRGHHRSERRDSAGRYVGGRPFSGSRKGENPVVVHVLKEQDRLWIARETGVEMPPGAPIAADFDQDGRLDRESFMAKLESRVTCGPDGAGRTASQIIPNRGRSNRDSFIAILQSFRQMNVTLDLTAVTPILAGAPAAGRIKDALRRALPNRKDPLKALGKVLLLGSTGNVGDGILRALSGRVPIDTPVRDTARVKDASHLGSVKFPVRQLPLATYGAQGDPGADTHDTWWRGDPPQLKTGSLEFRVGRCRQIPFGLTLRRGSGQDLSKPCSGRTGWGAVPTQNGQER